jgi:hypothetical protein
MIVDARLAPNVSAGRARPASSVRRVRPATTLTLGLLLAAILIAGVISLARL